MHPVDPGTRAELVLQHLANRIERVLQDELDAAMTNGFSEALVTTVKTSVMKVFENMGADNPQTNRHARIHTGPQAQKLREVGRLSWMMEKVYHQRNDIPGVPTLEEALKEVDQTIAYFGPSYVKGQTREDIEECINNSFQIGDRQEDIHPYQRSCYEWTRDGGTKVLVYVVWEIVDEFPKVKVNEIMIHDALEDIVYAGTPENVELVELVQAIELLFANGDVINPEK